MEFAKSNPIYALVCIGFLIPAEKFFRKMFGFDKATTSGQLGAAAGGAMVMNAINKISKGSGGKSGGKGKSGSGSSEGSDSSPTRFNPRPDGGSPETDPPVGNPILGGGNALGGDVSGATRKPRKTIKRNRQWNSKCW